MKLLNKIITLWVIAWLVSPASATYVWDNGGADNKWSTAENWSSTLVPVDTSTVVFDATSTDSCYVDIAARWKELTIDNAYTGKINLSTSIDTSYGNVKTGTGVTVFPSTSKIIFKGTGNDTLWSAGETYNNIVINKSAGTFRTGDRTACGDFDVDDGAFTLAYPIQYSGNATIDCNDAVAFSDSAIGTGNSKQFHVGSTVSSIAATACRRVYRGTGMTEDIDKASTFNALICDASSGLTTTGAAEYSTTSSQVPVITGASSALTINSGMTYITASSTGNMYSIGGTIDGSIANLFFFTAASTANAPAMAHTGSTNIYIQENAVGTAPVITQTGNISSGYGLILRRNNATNKTTWRQNGYSLTALWMCWGSSEATGTFDWHAKGTVTSNGAINVFGADVGASTIYDTATWVCKNNMPWLTKCTHLAAPGSNWTFTTNNSTITSSGKFYPKKITLNQATKTFAFADAMKADTLIITAGTATTAGTGNDTVVNYLQQNGGNLSIGNPLYAGYFDIDDGYLYQGAQPITAETGFDWSTDDSLAWDGTITVSGDGCAKFTGTKWYADGNLDMKGTGDFLWNINSGDRRLTGFYTMGYAGKTVTWLVPDATNKYPTFGNGARLICPSATGNIAGFLDFYFTAGAGDTIWQTNGATFAADSGEIEVTASNAGNVYVGGIKAANVFMNFRPYNQADTMRFYYLGDVTAVRMNCNSQYNYRGEQYFAGNTYTIGTGGFSAGSNGSTVHTLFSRTGGAFTSAGNFSTDGEVDFNAGTGTYAVGGNLSIGAGTNNLGTAEWTLNGAGAQALSADTLYKLTINKAGGTVTTSKSIGLGTDFTLTAGTLDISGSDTMYFGGNVTTSAGTITTAATSLWKVLKDGATLAMNALSWPITALTGSATIEDGGTFAELRPDAAGADTVKFEKLKKFIFTASDSAYWNGGAGTLNYYLTTTAGTRCTLDFEATKRFSYTAWKDMVSADTLYLNDGTNISLGGNIWP